MEKSNQNRLWVMPLLLILVLGGVVAVRNWQPSATDGKSSLKQKSEPASGELVTVEIDTGEGMPLSFDVPCEAGTTVRDAVAQVADGDLTFVVKGDDTGAFLSELAGFANEGAGGRNWQFEVNGKWADRSFAVYELQPGDHILWKFAESE